MAKSLPWLTGLSLLTLIQMTLTHCGGTPPPRGSEPQSAVSGRLDAGLRVLTFDPKAANQRFTIYRGDYVRPELANGGEFTLEIPALQVSRKFPAAAEEHPYFKVPDAGTFEFRIGEAGGTIEAIEYHAAQYREVDSREAARMIANVKPLILDVRTEREFAAGHIPDATLIPVQELQRRLGELTAHKRDPILVYCASGNRSTVASKMLVDAGFVQVVNLRRGFGEWSREGLPTVK